MNIDEAIKLNGEEFLDNILNGNIEDLIIINQYIKYQREDGMLLILKAAIMSKIRKLTSSYIFMKEIYFEDKIIELQKKIKSNTITNDENELLEQLKDEKLLFDKDVLKHQKGNKKQLFPNSDFDYYKYFEETKFHFFSEQLLATLKLTDIRINEQKKKNPPLPKELTPEKQPQLTKELTTKVQYYLFVKLKEKSFIPDNTNYHHFCFVFGSTPIPANEQPFKPIKWKECKQSLRMLLLCDAIRNKTLKQKEIKEITKKFIHKNNNSFTFSSNQPKTTTNISIMEHILKDIPTM